MANIDQWASHSAWQAWWKLSKVKGLGVVHIHRLRHSLKVPAELLSLSDDELHALGLSHQAIADFRAPLTRQHQTCWDQMLAWIQVDQQFIVTMFDQDFPESLAALNDPPVALFGQGNRSTLASANQTQAKTIAKVAMVGSRYASPAGRQWAFQTAQQLADAGVVVVSGLAIGIDAAAHQGALAADSINATIAVLGSGVDRIYPRQHQQLAQQISQQGCLLSEYHLGTAPLAAHFPSRNRLISGLVDAVIIVEAKLKSGSMITARLAAEQGREVMAVPGPVQNPSSHGPHQLIKDGALLVESADDIINHLGYTSSLVSDRLANASSANRSSVNRSSLKATEESAASSDHSQSCWVQAKGGAGSGQISGATRASLQISAQAENQEPDVVTETVPAIVSCIDFSPTTVDVVVARSQRPIAGLLAELMQLELDGWIEQVAGGYIRRR